MKIKTSDLTNAALDWAVAKCEDFRDWTAIIRLINGTVTKITPGGYEDPEVYTKYNPSTSWAQGGPLVERENISISDPAGDRFHPGEWAAYRRFLGTETRGPTPLIAAMRCYVASKLGDTVDIPEELV